MLYTRQTTEQCRKFSKYNCSKKNVPLKVFSSLQKNFTKNNSTKENYDTIIVNKDSYNKNNTNTNDIPPDTIKVAVLLSGCGVFDGSEITEAVSTLIHLSALQIKYACFAPDLPTYQVVDHSKGEPDINESPRNIYKESARIARGKILPLRELNVEDFHALIIPGGFGIAKNFSNFVDKGYEMEVIESVKTVICDFNDNNKPIGLMCIAPILAASIFRDDVAVTVGGSNDDNGMWPFHGTVPAIEAMGAKHIDTTLQQICIDKKSNIVSCPAYMCGTAKPHQVHENIGMLVSAIRDLAIHSI